MVRKFLIVSCIVSFTSYSAEIHQHSLLLNKAILQLGNNLKTQRVTFVQLQNDLNKLPFTELSATERARMTEIQTLIKLVLKFAPKEAAPKKLLLAYDLEFLKKLENVIQPARQTLAPLPKGPVPSVPTTSDPESQTTSASGFWKLLGY